MLLPITKQIVQMNNTKIIRANYTRRREASSHRTQLHTIQVTEKNYLGWGSFFLF